MESRIDKKFFIFFLSIITVFFFSYCQYKPRFGERTVSNHAAVSSSELNIAAENHEYGALIDVWNQRRLSVELNYESLLQTELFPNMQDLPEISTKWRMLHFYSSGNDLLRVKTYPQNQEVGRCEEFYFQDSQLYMAVIIEPNDDKTEPTESFEGRRYYFDKGKLFYKSNESDNERLLEKEQTEKAIIDEAYKYVKIFNVIMEI